MYCRLTNAWDLLQPVIFSVGCSLFGITFAEVKPPVHPKNTKDVHIMITMEDSACERSV